MLPLVHKHMLKAASSPAVATELALPNFMVPKFHQIWHIVDLCTDLVQHMIWLWLPLSLSTNHVSTLDSSSNWSLDSFQFTIKTEKWEILHIGQVPQYHYNEIVTLRSIFEQVNLGQNQIASTLHIISTTRYSTFQKLPVRAAFFPLTTEYHCFP